MQGEIYGRIQAAEARNADFPSLIPMNIFEREAGALTASAQEYLAFLM
jgi:hypothetical protein